MASSRSPKSAITVAGPALSPTFRAVVRGNSSPQTPSPTAVIPMAPERVDDRAGRARTRSVASVMRLPPGAVKVTLGARSALAKGP